MLKTFLPPICLLLALALAITGFAMIAFGAPEASVSLHEARAAGDELATSTLEQHLEDQQWSRITFITLLFVASGAMTFVAFGSMGESRK